MIYASTGHIPVLNQSLSLRLESRGERNAESAQVAAFDATGQTIEGLREKGGGYRSPLDDLLSQPSVHAAEQRGKTDEG